jgi:hypothetical protein
MIPCERFTVLESRRSESLSQCDVCDHPEAAHETPGRRILSGGEIEALRRRMIVETHDKLEERRQRSDGST